MPSRIIQFALFITVALVVVGSVHFYFYLRLVRDPELPTRWRQIVSVALATLAASMIVAAALGRALPFAPGQKIVWLPYLWMGAMVVLFFCLVGLDLVRAVTHVGFFVREQRSGAPNPLADPSTRVLGARSFAALAVTVTVALTAVAALRAAGPPTVRRIEVRLARLPAAFDGFTICHISDLHLGLTLGGAWLREVVDTVRGLRPDLVAVTGDLVDGPPDRLRHELEPLGELRAAEGVFFVTGNHEYYSGVEQWLPLLQKAGWRVLRNEHVMIARGGENFALAGVDDYTAEGMAEGHRHDPQRALSGIAAEKEVVLLAHQPRSVPAAAARGVGLVLTGHTHGGQFWPFTYLVRLQQPYLGGLYAHEPRTQVYVNEGTGFWGPPMRLGTSCEIALVTLRAGA